MPKCLGVGGLENIELERSEVGDYEQWLFDAVENGEPKEPYDVNSLKTFLCPKK